MIEYAVIGHPYLIDQSVHLRVPGPDGEAWVSQTLVVGGTRDLIQTSKARVWGLSTARSVLTKSILGCLNFAGLFTRVENG